jgi:hypothetical protein
MLRPRLSYLPLATCLFTIFLWGSVGPAATVTMTFASAAVPEPMTLVLVGLGLVDLVMRHYRQLRYGRGGHALGGLAHPVVFCQNAGNIYRPLKQ